MTETQPSNREISIPFIWEEKPGTPKRDLNITPTRRQLDPCPLPTKLVVSIPFSWEEKPGTPLRSFVKPSHDIIASSPPKYDSGSSETSNSFDSKTESSSVGSSFLERLFPLLASSRFSNKVIEEMEMEMEMEMEKEKDTSVRDKELLGESNCNRVEKPLLTLEELMVMSRRRSCKRKVNRMQQQTSMDFVMRNTWGCFVFASGNGKKRPLQRKLM